MLRCSPALPLLPFVLLCTGCELIPREASGPLVQVWDRAEAKTRAHTLVVLLPGRGDRPEDFAKADVTATLRATGAEVDTVAVDAHLGYYLNRSIVNRLHDEVLQPARNAGYQRIVLMGVSLGAVGSLFALRDHPDCVDAVVLLAPFAGENRKLLSTVAAGGDPAGVTNAPEHERELWNFIRECPKTSLIWMGSGASDRLGEGQRLLAQRLPAGQVCFVRGGHDWRTWRKLWHDWGCRLPVFQQVGAGRVARPPPGI